MEKEFKISVLNDKRKHMIKDQFRIWKYGCSSMVGIYCYWNNFLSCYRFWKLAPKDKLFQFGNNKINKHYKSNDTTFFYSDVTKQFYTIDFNNHKFIKD